MARELKNARVRRNLSIDEISKLVKISSKHIEKIEEGDFTFLPPLYVYSYIRKYAGELGLDNQELLDQCRSDLQIPNESILKRDTGEGQSAGEKTQGSGPGSLFSSYRGTESGPLPKVIIAVAATGLLLVLFFLFRSWAPLNSSVETVPADTRSVPQQPVVPTPPLPAAAVFVPDSTGMPVSRDVKEWPGGTAFKPDASSAYQKVLVIRVLDAVTWVKVVADNGEKTYGGHEFKPGDVLRIEAKQKLWVNIGRPSKVELFLNGEQIPTSSKKTMVLGQ
jgi:cytoskeletal protein RodZ